MCFFVYDLMGSLARDCRGNMLSERSHSKHVPLTVVLQDQLPVAGLRVHHHLVHDAVAGRIRQLLKVHIQDYILLLVVAHEGEIDFELLGTSLGRNCHLVGLLGLLLRGEDLVGRGQSLQLHLSEEVKWLSAFVDATKLDLRALLN